MFGTVIVAANSYRSHLIRLAANSTNVTTIQEGLDHYPDRNDLVRILSRYEPKLVLLDAEDAKSASACARWIREQSSEIAILAVGGEPAFSKTSAIPQLVSFPPHPVPLGTALAEALHAAKPQTSETLIAFVPSKAGAGCSTVALNTAAAVARHCRQKVLLLDADLRSGAISLMLNWQQEELRNQGYLQTALTLVSEMDELRWESTVTSVEGIDLLLSNGTPLEPPPTWGHYHGVIRFAAPRYNFILVDLPELVNPASAEIVQTANRVCLVTTQELLSVKMAHKRIRELRHWGVPEDRIFVLVNRWHKRQVPSREVGSFLRYPILGTFPNNYGAVNSATMEGRPVSPGTDLGRAFQKFAERLLEMSEQPKPAGGLLNWVRQKVAVG